VNAATPGQTAYEARQAAKTRRMGAPGSEPDSTLVAIIGFRWDDLPPGQQADEEAAARAAIAAQQPQPAPDPRPASMLDLADFDDEPEPLSDVVAVPFPAGVIAAARRLAAAEGMTASAWIRREIERREQPAPARGKRDPLACPCCVFGGDDCWCRTDCGAERCQAGEPQPAPELATADRLVRDILESLCRRDGLSLESTVVPGEPARNYALAERLGIGHVFGLLDAAPAAPAADLRPREGEPGWHDVTCGSCGSEFGTNFAIDQIDCVECGARRCPHCATWFGGEEDDD
jgi:hypothetical protein